MYLRYAKSRASHADRFQAIEQCSLFGCNVGFVPWLLRQRTPSRQEEPYEWHVPVEEALASTEYAGSALVIDLKPKQSKKNLSLYEVLDVWGCSNSGWTPILLHLSGLYVDREPTGIDRDDFKVLDSERDGPIYEFLYLDGSFRAGELVGPWVPPPASPTNAALLWPESLRYFRRCIDERTPEVWNELGN